MMTAALLELVFSLSLDSSRDIMSWEDIFFISLALTNADFALDSAPINTNKFAL